MDKHYHRRIFAKGNRILIYSSECINDTIDVYVVKKHFVESIRNTVRVHEELIKFCTQSMSLKGTFVTVFYMYMLNTTHDC